MKYNVPIEIPGPPAMLGYMFAIVCVSLHSFRGSGKEGLLTLNFPQGSFMFQYVVSTGFHATFRQKQMVWVFSTKTTQCKAGSIWKLFGSNPNDGVEEREPV